jgi:hypothetical protein
MGILEMTDQDMLDDQIDDVRKIVEGISDPKVKEPIQKLIDSLCARIGDLEDESDVHALESAVEDTEDAINRFLDVVDRPCGTRKFIIPETGERDRALIGLYDAIGRRL